MPKHWKHNPDMSKFTVDQDEPMLGILFKHHDRSTHYHLNQCTTKRTVPGIVKQYFISPRSEIFFINALDSTTLDWEYIYQLPYKLTLDTKLREFHWKLTHNILPTNVLLHKMTPPRVPSSACTFCKDEEESILHLFCNCNHVKVFWNTFTENLGKRLGLKTPLNPELILLGSPKLPKLLNVLILVAKRYIYKARCNSKELYFTNFTDFVQNVQKIEFYIPNRKNKLDIHIKWGKYFQIVGQ